MKTLKILLPVFLCLLILSSTVAYGTTYSFTDNSRHWPLWGNAKDDSQDVLGIPDYISGEVTITQNAITEITFDYTGNSSYWDVLFPGDLFIDTGADAEWDYLVRLFLDINAGPAPDNIYHQPSIQSPGSYDLYNVDGQFLRHSSDETLYILTGKDAQGNWCKGSPNNSHYNNSWLIRDDHPVALDISGYSLAGSVSFSGWSKNNPAGTTRTATFDFTNYPIPLSEGDFIIGWTLNCANDVIYEQISYTPTPEPGTILLFCIGLIGLAFLNKKRRSKG